MKSIFAYSWVAIILGALFFSAFSFAQSGGESGSYSKIYLAIALTIVGTVIAPMWVERDNVSRSKKILKGMILSDISDRTKQITTQREVLEVMVEKYINEPDYEPIMIIARGMEDYIDWKTEKWLLPTDLSGDILSFYNDEASLYQFISIIFENEKFEKKLSKERKIGAMESLYLKMIDLESRANKLIPLLT